MQLKVIIIYIITFFYSMNKQKREAQFEDASEKLWLAIPEDDIKRVIFLWWKSGESITLAKAILDCTSNFKIVLINIVETPFGLSDGGFLEVTLDWTIPTTVPGNPIYSSQSGIFPLVNLVGNAHKTKKYTEDKSLMYFILSKNWISIPKQITLGYTPRDYKDEEVVPWMTRIHNVWKENREQAISTINTFLNQNGSAVLKPISGSCWEDIVIIEAESFDQIEKMEQFKIFESLRKSRCVLQKYVPSYPVVENWEKMDWNLRALVTYDYDKKNYIVAWTTGRIDKHGGPINRSISADNISLEEIFQKAWISKKKLEKLKKKIAILCNKASHALVNVWARRMEDYSTFTNVQILFGVDIIIDENLEPHIIEVNDINSWCAYELMLLEWIESIYPIAKSILGKIDSVEKLNLFAKDINKKKAFFSNLPSEYMKGNIDLKTSEGWDVEVVKNIKFLKAKIKFIQNSIWIWIRILRSKRSEELSIEESLKVMDTFFEKQK